MENQFENLTRPKSNLDQILGVPFKVLDDGFIRVVDYMGNDEAIVQAARVSYGKGTKKIHEDRGLIRYLLRHRHTTPFEMCELKIHIRIPMDAWRQWIRHRTANVNEYSTRYSLAIDSTQKTPVDSWRMQSQGNRQGSSGFFETEVGESFSKEEKELHELSNKIYLSRIEKGMAREQARKDLPLSTYTEAYWKVDLHNLLHFVSLRMDEHAQLEIREYAKVLGEKIIKEWCPIAWEAFMDYNFHSTHLSRIEIEMIRLIQEGNEEKIFARAVEFGLLDSEKGKEKKSREREELEEKLSELGIRIPWL
ncbi:MAG: FAD-dependent thymidylate synthase [Leptospiraceae bacterium]|nr:FAD-dependent thymidylate synthase [Leptospiraceae bacterium]